MQGHKPAVYSWLIIYWQILCTMCGCDYVHYKGTPSVILLLNLGNNGNMPQNKNIKYIGKIIQITALFY